MMNIRSMLKRLTSSAMTVVVGAHAPWSAWATSSLGGWPIPEVGCARLARPVTGRPLPRQAKISVVLSATSAKACGDSVAAPVTRRTSR
jgi:hypothetical protein